MTGFKSEDSAAGCGVMVKRQRNVDRYMARDGQVFLVRNNTFTAVPNGSFNTQKLAEDEAARMNEKAGP